MRRLFSGFARGWPGAGLLFMRLAAGIALVTRAVAILCDGPKLGPAILQLLTAGAGLLLLSSGRSLDKHPVGYPLCSPGVARTWRLVG